MLVITGVYVTPIFIQIAFNSLSFKDLGTTVSHTSFFITNQSAGTEPFTYRHFVRMFTQEASPIDPTPSAMATRRAASARPPVAATGGVQGIDRPVTCDSPTRVTVASLSAWNDPTAATHSTSRQFTSALARTNSGKEGPLPFGTFGKNLGLATWKTSVRAGEGVRWGASISLSSVSSYRSSSPLLLIHNDEYMCTCTYINTQGAPVPLHERPDLNASSTHIFKTWAAAERTLCLALCVSCPLPLSPRRSFSLSLIFYLNRAPLPLPPLSSSLPPF